MRQVPRLGRPFPIALGHFSQGAHQYCPPGTAFVPLGSAKRILGLFSDPLSSHSDPVGAFSRAALVHYLSFPVRNFFCFGPGFSTKLDRVKNLPHCETEIFEVRFDSQGANLPVGSKEVILPIKVQGTTEPTRPCRFPALLADRPKIIQLLCQTCDSSFPQTHAT